MRTPRPADFYADMWSTISSGDFGAAICNMHKDASRYWVLATVSPMFGPTGTITGYIGIRTDITGQKFAEEASAVQARVDPLTGCANRRGFNGAAGGPLVAIGR